MEMLLKGLIHFCPIIGWPLAILYLVIKFVATYPVALLAIVVFGCVLAAAGEAGETLAGAITLFLMFYFPYLKIKERMNRKDV